MLIICLVLADIAFINLYEVEANAYIGLRGKDGFLYATKETQYQLDELKDNINWQNSEGLSLNLDLFVAKSIRVYGSCYDIADNDFKNGTVKDVHLLDGEVSRNEGFYQLDGKKGEYRYHGYDGSGNLYTNINFPVDDPMIMPATSYNWVYRIWDHESDYYDEDRLREASRWFDFVDRINNQMYLNKLKQQIELLAPFNMSESRSTNENKDMYNYAHVLWMSTKNKTGEIRLDHVDNAGNLWYVNFSTPAMKVPKVSENIVVAEFDEGTLNIANFDKLESGDDVQLSIRLDAELLDDMLWDDSKNYEFEDEVMRQVINNREDIDYWTFSIYDDVTMKTRSFPVDTSNRIASYMFTITLPYEDIKDRIDVETNKLNIYLLGEAQVNFDTGEDLSDTDEINDSLTYTQKEEIKEITPEDLEEHEKPLYPVIIDIVGPTDMLDTEKFGLIDTTFDKAENVNNTDSRITILEGKILDEDEEDKFLNGEWIFPLIAKDKIYNYSIIYTNKNGVVNEYKSYVKVYTSKPKIEIIVAGLQKENRLLTAKSDIDSVNSSYLLSRTTSNINDINVLGEAIYFGDKTDKELEFISKKPFTDIEVSSHVEFKINPKFIERNDIPSDYHKSSDSSILHVVEDYGPAVVSNIWNFVLTRNEALNMTYEAVSTDGDLVVIDEYELYYDEDGDKKAEKLIKTGNSKDLNGFVPDRLGMYTINFYVEEIFGDDEQTLPEHITEKDLKNTSLARNFYVDNLAPNTEIYIDVPISYPEVDIVVLNDESINRELNNEIISTRVNFQNNLIRSSLNPQVQIWDLHTYKYNQSASTSYNSGSTLPTATLEYTSNGYSGILSLYDSKNNRYMQDLGKYVYVTKSKYVTATGAGSGWSKYFENVMIDSGGTSQPTIEYDSGGYKGTLSKLSFKQTGITDTRDDTGTGVVTRYYSAEYGGTVSGKIREWDSDWTWFDNYTGYYSGTLYKSIIQNFIPSYRDSSSKYLVYFTNDKVNNLVEYQNILDRSDSKVIVIGNDVVKNDSRIKEDLFLDESMSIDDIYNRIIEFIIEDNPQKRGVVVLTDQEFDIRFVDIDTEGDEIGQKEFQIVHDQNYFDNPTGQEINTNEEFDYNNFNMNELPKKLSNSGEYTFYRQIKDAPLENPDEGEFSNIAVIDIYAHRKPIANCKLDWEFNMQTGVYVTRWEDLSFDLDLQFKDPEGTRGIRERKIKYRKIGSTNWIYDIPDNLYPGEYELEYLVKDNYGIWSDPFEMTFNLPVLPPPKISGKLKAELPVFSLNSIPASENLVAYDVLTIYPYDVSLNLALYDGNTRISPIIQKTMNSNHGIINDQSMSWYDISYTIPPTLMDKQYTMKISAIDTVNSSLYADLNFEVIVDTPIDLTPKMSTTLTANQDINITANTSKYVNSAYLGSGVNVTLFYGTPYAETLNLNGNTENWNLITKQSESIPEGEYTARFIATLPSGKYEVKSLNYMYSHNSPPSITDVNVYTGVSVATNYIYENDDVKFSLEFNDTDLSELDVSIKLYNINDLSNSINSFSESVNPNSEGKYDAYIVDLVDNILLGDYKIISSVTDDYGVEHIVETFFTAHDLWIDAKVEHTEEWEENRLEYNEDYPSKHRAENVYWSGEAFVTKANTTVINEKSNVECTKVSVEIVNLDDISSQAYTDWLNPVNTKKDNWNLKYYHKDWDNKWGNSETQEIILRFKAHFNNGWVEVDDVPISIDNVDPFWELHRAW